VETERRRRRPRHCPPDQADSLLAALRERVREGYGLQESQVLASMDNLGGRAAWGVQPGAGGAVAVDPGLFAEQLFPAVLRLLNAVMAATPPAYVRGQQPTPDSGPRWYSERNRLSVSRHLGF
jgi:hypothetical protein